MDQKIVERLNALASHIAAGGDVEWAELYGQAAARFQPSFHGEGAGPVVQTTMLQPGDRERLPELVAGIREDDEATARAGQELLEKTVRDQELRAGSDSSPEDIVSPTAQGPLDLRQYLRFDDCEPDSLGFSFWDGPFPPKTSLAEYLNDPDVQDSESISPDALRYFHLDTCEVDGTHGRYDLLLKWLAASGPFPQVTGVSIYPMQGDGSAEGTIGSLEVAISCFPNLSRLTIYGKASAIGTTGLQTLEELSLNLEGPMSLWQEWEGIDLPALAHVSLVLDDDSNGEATQSRHSKEEKAQVLRALLSGRNVKALELRGVSLSADLLDALVSIPEVAALDTLRVKFHWIDDGIPEECRERGLDLGALPTTELCGDLELDEEEAKELLSMFSEVSIE